MGDGRVNLLICSRTCKTWNIPMGFRRENGLFINLNYREGHKIIGPLPFDRAR
jgi:hypothetical protein